MKTQTYWLTGASGGIGAALARRLNGAGQRLILSARNQLQLTAVQQSLPQPTRAAIVPLDLADYSSLERALPLALEAFGGVDVMIHSGGISQRDLVVNTKFEVDERLMKVNYLGTVYLTKLILPHFLEKSGGDFIVISSLVGKFGTPYRSSYAASKHALHGFFDSMRAELQGQGIKILMVCPGFVKTDISLHALTGTGEPLGVMDEAQAKGMEPALLAERILQAFQGGKEEVYIGGPEVWGVYMKRFLPTLMSKRMAKAKVR